MKHPLVLAGIFFCLFLATLGALLLYQPQDQTLRNYGEAPDFAFTDTQEQTFGSQNLEGKVWVADFFFSTCAGPCPTMSANMKKLHDRFEDREDVNFVSITVNPYYDKPDILAKYAKKLRADTNRWHFLSGDEAKTLDVAVKGFKIGDPDSLINHSQKFVLVDRNGIIRGYYEGTSEEEVAQLGDAIQGLLRESAQASAAVGAP